MRNPKYEISAQESLPWYGFTVEESTETATGRWGHSVCSVTLLQPIATHCMSYLFYTTQMIYFEPIYQTKSIYLVIDFHAMNFQKPHHVTHQWTSRKGKLRGNADRRDTRGWKTRFDDFLENGSVINSFNLRNSIGVFLICVIFYNMRQQMKHNWFY